jgi:anti-sigma factor ChrR (cupin superfamily)
VPGLATAWREIIMNQEKPFRKDRVPTPDHDVCLSDADMGRLWEGDVTPEEREGFARHMEICDRCRRDWEKTSAGAKYLQTTFDAGEEEHREDDHPSIDVLAAYAYDALAPQETEAISDHLASCALCEETVSETRAFRAGEDRDEQVVILRSAGRHLLGVLARTGDEAPALLDVVRVEAPQGRWSPDDARVPALLAPHIAAQRVAAAEGEGFTRQTIRQEEPPFELSVVQFGEQLRVSARVLDEASGYADCLARLEFFEGDRCRLARVILVEHGRSECILSPEDAKAARPDSQGVKVRLSPLVTLEQLAEAGADAYMPILAKLLRNADSRIRLETIRVLERLGGPRACELIRRMTDDTDAQVRVAAQRVLERRGT